MEAIADDPNDPNDSKPVDTDAPDPGAGGETGGDAPEGDAGTDTGDVTADDTADPGLDMGGDMGGEDPTADGTDTSTDGDAGASMGTGTEPPQGPIGTIILSPSYATSDLADRLNGLTDNIDEAIEVASSLSGKDQSVVVNDLKDLKLDAERVLEATYVSPIEEILPRYELLVVALQKTVARMKRLTPTV